MKKVLLAGAALGLLMAGPAWADIKIATAGPMTGQYASFGEQMKGGAEQAVEDINAAGGVLGEKLVLSVGDDACDPKQAVAVANQFAGEGVVFVAGHFCSGSSIPASQVYSEEGIVQISPASTNPDFTDKRPGPGVFRTCGRDDQQGSIAGAYLAENFKDAKIAIIDDKTPYGQGLAEETKKAMNAAGVTEVVREGVNTGDKDFSALIAKMKEAGVSIIYWGGLHTEAGLIIRQAADQGLDATLVSGDGIVSNELASIAGDAVEGTLNTFGPDPRLAPQNKELVEKFRASGFEPEAYTLYSYAAMQVLAEAAKKAGSNDPEAVAEAMKANTFATALGDMGFDEKGDPKLPGYVMYEWKKGPDGNYSYFQKED